MPRTEDGVAYSEARDTSVEAAHAVSRARLSAYKSKIINALECNPDGLTVDELADLLQEDALYAVRRRVSELAKDGLLFDGGERRVMKAGRNGIVWKKASKEQIDERQQGRGEDQPSPEARKEQAVLPGDDSDGSGTHGQPEVWLEIQSRDGGVRRHVVAYAQQRHQSSGGDDRRAGQSSCQTGRAAGMTTDTKKIPLGQQIAAFEAVLAYLKDKPHGVPEEHLEALSRTLRYLEPWAADIKDIIQLLAPIREQWQDAKLVDARVRKPEAPEPAEE